jgi:hypothetical protein
MSQALSTKVSAIRERLFPKRRIDPTRRRQKMDKKQAYDALGTFCEMLIHRALELERHALAPARSIIPYSSFIIGCT